MNKLTIRKALNKAFLKVKPNRQAIDDFKETLHHLLQNIDPTESEEFNKNLLSDFFKNVAFQSEHFINTNSRTDLVIHQGKHAKTPVAVMIEAKKPNKKAEMPTTKNLNAKATQELVLYYLRERITNNNLAVKHLIITDTLQWFVFDAAEFEKHFASDKQLVKQFQAFEAGNLSGKKTDFFYHNIAKAAIDKVQKELAFTHFDLNDYQKIAATKDTEKDKKLIPLFKILSPEHLLKLKFANDSNTLDKRFYAELLHLIGLHEVGKSKKTIERLPKGKRNNGSLLENTMVQLESTNRLRRLNNRKQYGSTEAEQLEAVALELVITWVNRILFLKLLEAQLLTYHKGDKSYSFLNYEKLNEYDEVSALFFQVLAKQPKDRTVFNHDNFVKVPYLNSSLFEPTDLEEQMIFINALRDKFDLPLLTTTVLKNDNGKRLTGNLNTLQYLFAFLDAYDFASEGTEDIQEQSKTIINASVLGLIFEKINGYKDGSFFTPGFITMYMCRETLRRAVIQKFNDAKGWNCETFNDLYHRIRDRKAANDLINSLKICDPAVGSGHFLVSALNEMIAIKHDLGILQDENGKGFRDYRFEVENDELVVWDEQEDQLFQYNPKSKESLRIQKTLFHEKQTIIESCLFGVDINPNSVKICRLRLWIELLKNAYYKNETELETLPNIDINIQCGNSLISRYDLDTDLKEVLKEAKKQHGITIKKYRDAFQRYRQTNDKAVKYEMAALIKKVKATFRTSIAKNSKENKQLAKLSQELYFKYNATSLFETKLTKAQKKDKATLTKKVDDLTHKIKAIENNVIYENAFEWRFEFPEVLNDKGDFVGFDVVIGNPPYGVKLDNKKLYKFLYPNTSFGQIDTYKYFIDRGLSILNINSFLSYITSDSYLEKEYFKDLRIEIVKNSTYIKNIKLGDDIFDEVNLPTAIIEVKKGKQKTKEFLYLDLSNENIHSSNSKLYTSIFNTDSPDFNKQFSISKSIIKTSKVKPLIECYNQVMGVKVYQRGKGKPKQTNYERENNVFIFSSFTNKPNLLPFISKGVKRYFYEDKNEFINYGEWLAEPRDKIIFTNPRVVIREIINPRVYATYFDYPAVIKNTSAVVTKKNDEYLLTYFLGLINSKLMTYHIFEQTPKSSNKSYPSFSSRLLKSLPIAIADLKIQAVIGEKAIQILTKKQENPEADTSDLEAEIDQLVYALYGLTAEEIAIVEKGWF